jgi:hypothetical protein
MADSFKKRLPKQYTEDLRESRGESARPQQQSKQRRIVKTYKEDLNKKKRVAMEEELTEQELMQLYEAATNLEEDIDP